MEVEKTFGIVSEGITDQVILENILYGWTGNKNIPITRLQPKEDISGNWDKVFKYCQSIDFKGAFSFCDFVIIQIDTDFMQRGEVTEQFKIDIQNLTVKQIIDAFKTKFIELIGQEFYKEYSKHIIFAISVNEIECWLLPIYFYNKKAKAAKTTNCINTLNTVLKQQEGFYIDAKKMEYYEKIAKHLRKKKNIEKFAPKNPSFEIFINNIEQINLNNNKHELN